MLIKNGELFVDGAFRKLDMRVENGYIRLWMLQGSLFCPAW